MWNMMCDVLPTISEDSISQRSSQFSGGEDANFEQLMVSMLDERDKLMDSLREAQERLNEMEGKLGDCEKERDSLHRQINANLPQVSVNSKHSIEPIRLFLPLVVLPFWRISISIDLVSWELSHLITSLALIFFCYCFEQINFSY
jgi:hypothetical protein